MSNELDELSQWFWSWWPHHEHCCVYYYYYTKNVGSQLVTYFIFHYVFDLRLETWWDLPLKTWDLLVILCCRAARDDWRLKSLILWLAISGDQCYCKEHSKMVPCYCYNCDVCYCLNNAWSEQVWLVLISVSLKSSADHVGECFCLCSSSAAVTPSSAAGQASAMSAAFLGHYSLTVQRQVLMCIVEYLRRVVNIVVCNSMAVYLQW